MLYQKGDMIEKGTYWNVATGEKLEVENAMLATDTYLKMPTVLMLALGPVLGLLFAVFLPFIGIAMSIKFLVDKAFEGTRELAAQSMSFGWRPIEAYLTGRKKKKEKKEKIT